MKAHIEPKNFWKYANSKLKTKSNIPDLFVNTNKNSLTKTDGEKVEVLSEFFSSVFTRPSIDSQPPFDNKFISYPMEPLNFDSKMVEKLLLDLKPLKSPGHDGIHPKVLRELAAEVAAPLTAIFSHHSLQELCLSLGKQQILLQYTRKEIKGILQIIAR